MRRWHQGTVYYERKHKGQDTEAARKAQEHIADIKKNRQWGQPYVRRTYVCAGDLRMLTLSMLLARLVRVHPVYARAVHEWMVREQLCRLTGSRLNTGVVS